jgi:WD40 repeat protein
MVRLKFTVAGMLGAVVLSSSLRVGVRGAIADDRPQLPDRASTPIATAHPGPARVDRFGDPLPEHATARLGRARFHHGEEVLGAEYSHDGKTVIARDLQGSIVVWDAVTGRKVRDIGDSASEFIVMAQSPDGKTLATIERPHRLRLWDLGTGHLRRQWHERPGEFYRSAFFSHDSRTLASECYLRDKLPTDDDPGEPSIVLWDLAAGTEYRRRIAGDWRGLSNLLFSADDRTIVAISRDRVRHEGAENPTASSARVWDVATGRELGRHRVVGCSIESQLMSGDGGSVVVGVTDGTIRLIDLKNGRESSRVSVDGFEGFPLGLSPDGKLLAAGLRDGTVHLFDFPVGRDMTRVLAHDSHESGQMRAELGAPKLTAPDGDPPGDWNRVVDLKFSPDGSMLAGTSLRSERPDVVPVHLWDIARSRELRPIFTHQEYVRSISFHPDGKTLALAGGGSMIRVWDVATARELVARPGHYMRIRALAVSPADGTVFTSGDDGTIRQWDPGSGRELGVIGPEPTRSLMMAPSPDGTKMLAGGLSGGLTLWNVHERRALVRFPAVKAGNDTTSFAYSPDGKTVAFGFQVWDVATGKSRVKLDDPNPDWNSPVFYSADGQQIITVEQEGIRIWDTESGEMVHWAVHSPLYPVSPALSHDGRLVAVRGVYKYPGGRIPNDPRITIWDLASGRQVATLAADGLGPRGMAFSPDGRFLASCGGQTQSSAHAIVQIWDVARGRELRRFEGHKGAVNAVVFTRDGRSVVSGGADATALVWDVSGLGTKPRTGAETPAD